MIAAKELAARRRRLFLLAAIAAGRISDKTVSEALHSHGKPGPAVASLPIDPAAKRVRSGFNSADYESSDRCKPGTKNNLSA